MRSASSIVVGEGLLAEDRLTRLRGGDGDLGVGVAGRADVHDVDVVARDDRFPVRRGLLESEPIRRFGNALGVAATDDTEARRRGQVEESADLTPRVRVGTAHEPVADHGDIQRRVLFGHPGS